MIQEIIKYIKTNYINIMISLIIIMIGLLLYINVSGFIDSRKEYRNIKKIIRANNELYNEYKDYLQLHNRNLEKINNELILQNKKIQTLEVINIQLNSNLENLNPKYDKKIDYIDNLNNDSSFIIYSNNISL